MVCRLRLYVPAVEKVTCYHDEIYATPYRVPLDHLPPCSEEIGGSVGQVISFDAEMNISYVKKPCHINNQTPINNRTARGPYNDASTI